MSVAAQESNGCVNPENNGDSPLIDLPFVPTGTSLLGRFGFAFGPREDHFLQQILIAPGFPPGPMRLGFADENGDDKYCYNVTHFDIRDVRIRQVSRGLDICSEAGRCTVRLDKPAGNFVFVLIGFSLSFRAPFDHPLQEVAILEKDGELTVAYNDEHFDPPEDTFLWSLQYAYVPRDRFRDVGELSGTGAKDRVLGEIPAGKAVLRGFRVKFSDGDHNIQQIGVRPNTTGTVFITYRDNDGNDKFDWEYRWAILSTLEIFPGEVTPGPINPNP
jgi:hypothetical protein